MCPVEELSACLEGDICVSRGETVFLEKGVCLMVEMCVSKEGNVCVSGRRRECGCCG